MLLVVVKLFMIGVRKVNLLDSPVEGELGSVKSLKTIEEIKKEEVKVEKQRRMSGIDITNPETKIKG